ncbi:uncharacterized protein LOC110850405 [Folsomia candida]|uniref:uncharacterized protein LOC110850405 n=1 Tax=Folsomia candida TaxID=158441 RepID=UPI001604DBFA|nr:uncharacterized protein LOC110850405 [Folsomia candida]
MVGISTHSGKQTKSQKEETSRGSDLNQKTLHSTQTSSLNSSVSSTKTAAKLQSIVLNKRVKQCKVFAITESYLDPDRDLSSTFQIPSYQTLRMDRESCCGKKSGGGLLIYIHESFNYDVIDFNFKLPGRVQILIVKVYCEFTKPIIVSVVYNPPDTDKSEFLNCFINLNTFLSTFKFEKLIVGDLNVNLIRKGNVFDIVAHKLLLLAREFNLSQIIKGPTHNASSLLDHMYVSDKDKFQNVFHFPFAGSDHDLCIVAFKKKHVKFPPRVIQCRDLKSIDWDIFNKDISDYTLNISKINNNVPSSVDEEFSNFNTHVMNVFDKHAPCSKKLVKSKHLPWFNNEICKLIKDRNRLLHKARKTNNLSDLKLYRTARNLVNYSMVKAKKKYFLCKFEKVTKSTCSMWKCIDELTGYTKKDSKPLSSLMVNNVYTNDKVKINDNLADSFVVNGSFQSISNDECDKAIKNYCENYDYSESRTNDYMPIDIKTFEVEGSISKIKNKQAKNVLMPTITVIKKCKNTFNGKVDAKCKECEKSGIAKIVQGSIKPTSNFTSHLKVHVEQYHNCQELMKNPLNKVKNHNKQQTTLPYSRTVIPAKSTKAENLVTNYIIDAMCPLSTVENSSFKNLISGLSDGNKCPSLKKLHLLITERYNNYVSSLIRDLSRIKYYCLTADVWSSRRRSFLGVTIHWLGEKLERHSSVLALRRFKGTHDFERINDTLQQIMSDFELVRDKITCIVTDNGSNFVKAFKEYGIDYQTEDEISESEEEIDLLDREEFVSQILLPSHQRCASHTLSLVATTDLNNVGFVYY